LETQHPSRKRRSTYKQRDIENDYNDKKSKVGGNPKKKKKAARKEQEKKVAEEAEGATKTYDEAVVLLADVTPKGKRIAESWSPREKTKTMASRSCKKDLTQTSSTSTTASSTSSARCGDDSPCACSDCAQREEGRRKTRETGYQCCR
jgi:hypothetical protein